MSTKEAETYGVTRLTAGGVLFLVVVRHNDWLVCGMEVVIGCRGCLFLGLSRVREYVVEKQEARVELET